MANYNINISSEYEPEFGGYLLAVTGAGSSSNRISLFPDDTLTITYISNNAGRTVTINTGTNYFTDGTLSLSSTGSSGTRMVKPAYTIGNQQISITMSGASNRYIYVYFEDAADNIPDPVPSRSISFAKLSEYYTFSFTVSGLSSNVSTTISVTGSSGRAYRINSGAWLTSTSNVFNGDYIEVRVLSPSAYEQATNTTVVYGNQTNPVFTVNTGVDPLSNSTFIPMGISSGPIYMTDLYNTFGGTYPIYIKDYYRSGSLVPNISNNSPNVPTSGDIYLTNFYNTGTALYFSKSPQQQTKRTDTTNSSATATLSWNTYENNESASDFWMGHGARMNAVVEFRYELFDVVAFGGGSSVTDVVLGASDGTYSSNNTNVTLSCSVPIRADRDYSGYVRIYARHIATQAVTITNTSFELTFFSSL